MPKVKVFTARQNSSRDRTAKALIRKGYSKSSAYAIATSNVKKRRKKK